MGAIDREDEGPGPPPGQFTSMWGRLNVRFSHSKPRTRKSVSGPIRHAEVTASSSDERKNALISRELSEMKIAA